MEAQVQRRYFRHPETVSPAEVDDDFLSAADDPRDEWPSEEDTLEQSIETGSASRKG